MFIAKNLHLDMARVDDHLFKIDVGIVETRLGFRAGRDKFFYKVFFAIGNPDPFSPAAGHSLDEDREAEFARLLEACLDIGDNALGSRNDRDISRFLPSLSPPLYRRGARWL